MPQIDKTTIRKGMFMTGGPPATGAQLTKVFIAESAEDLEAADREFERLSRLNEALEQTRKALAALKSKPN